MTSTADNLRQDPSVPTAPLLINNKAHHTSSTFPVHSPATGALLYNFGSASIADADAALEAAKKAYPSWRNMKPAQKRNIFLKAADLMESRRSEMERCSIQETGTSAGWAAADFHLGVEALRDVAGRITSIQGTIPTPAAEGVSALVYKEPYGVVLAIAPWNAPFILGIRSVAYALAAGNTAILKASESSPMCSYFVVKLFHNAGLPEGVLNLLAHKPSDAAAVTKHLIESPILMKLSFTGSTAVGKVIAELAGRNLKPVLLELGGKAPAVILEDADLEAAAAACAAGSVVNSGQICMSTERIIVLESVASAFEKHFIKAIAAFASDRQQAGFLINKEGVEKNKRLLRDATSKGATVIYGDVENGVGTKMTPVVVKGTNKEMDLYYTESFGPTVSLIVVKTEDEALALANDTEYGLSSSVFTRDLSRGLRFAKQIESGAVHINGSTVHDESALPHGGESLLILFFSGSI
jgi:acyl-CoA reductase-like NAD-dependent aldehyde dehydrogenase